MEREIYDRINSRGNDIGLNKQLAIAQERTNIIDMVLRNQFLLII